MVRAVIVDVSIKYAFYHVHAFMKHSKIKMISLGNYSILQEKCCVVFL